MSLKDIMAIGGKPGLYKFIAQAKSGIIVESLTDKKRIPAYASDKVSALEDIAIFTEDDEVPLNEVFRRIHEKEDGGKTISPKKSSADELKDYFSEILPEYDRERVYVSDIKKVIAWYNQLHELGMLSFEEEEEETGEEEKSKTGETDKTDNTAEEKSGESSGS